MIDVYYTNGYNVFTVARKQEDAQKLSKEFTSHFTPIVADLVDDNCIDIIKDNLTKSINHLDILINNAGIPGNAYKIADVTSTEMKALFDIHLGANFIIFCPDCKEMMFLECEYGYGPVTPCKLYYRDKVVGDVCTDAKNNYILNSSLLPTKIYLKSRYLDALHEATDIVQKLI